MDSTLFPCANPAYKTLNKAEGCLVVRLKRIKL